VLPTRYLRQSLLGSMDSRNSHSRPMRYIWLWLSHALWLLSLRVTPSAKRRELPSPENQDILLDTVLFLMAPDNTSGML
jgi:hypothetical protein